MTVNVFDQAFARKIQSFLKEVDVLFTMIFLVLGTEIEEHTITADPIKK